MYKPKGNSLLPRWPQRQLPLAIVIAKDETPEKKKKEAKINSTSK